MGSGASTCLVLLGCRLGSFDSGHSQEWLCYWMSSAGRGFGEFSHRKETACGYLEAISRGSALVSAWNFLIAWLEKCICSVRVCLPLASP